MPYDVWGPTNQAMGNLSNAMAGYRARQLAEQQAAQQAEQRRQQMELTAAQQNRQNALDMRRMKMEEEKHAQQQQFDALKTQELQRKEGVENLKMAYHAMDSVKDQASLNRVRTLAANMFGNNPEILEQIPAEYNDESAKVISGYRDMYGNALRDQLNQKEYWIESPDGRKNVAWFEEGETPHLPEGYKFATEPNDNMELAQISQDTTLKKARLDNAADIEKERIKGKSAAERQQMKLAASSRDNAFNKELSVKKYFDALPEVKAWTSIEPQYQNMISAVDEAKAQYGKRWAENSYADQALIMTFNKMLDPDSVVREAEYARTTEDQSMLSRIKSNWDSIFKGGKLNPKEREAMVRLAKRFRDTSESRYNKQVEYVNGLSGRWGLNAENIIRLGETPASQDSAKKMAYDKMKGMWGGGVEQQQQKVNDAPDIPEDMLKPSHVPVDAKNDGLMPSHEPTAPKQQTFKDRYVDVLKSAARAASPYYRPVMETGGAMVGGIVGAGGGIPTGPGAVATGAAGAGLGYAMGREGADLLDNFAGIKERGSLGEELIESGKDVAVGALTGGAPIASATAPAKTALVNTARNALSGGLGYAAGEEVEKLHRVAAGEEEPKPLRENLIEAGKNVAAGAAMDVIGEGVGKAVTASATGAKNALTRQAVDDAEKLGIKVLSSDANKPRSFIGKSAQALGERIPIAGTGGIRKKQQQQRIEAIRDTLKEFGAYDAAKASDDVMRDLSMKRSQELNRWKGVKENVFNKLKNAGEVPVNNALAVADAEIDRLKSISETEYKPAIERLERFKGDIQGKDISNVDENRDLIGKFLEDRDLATIRSGAAGSFDRVYRAINDDIGSFIRANGGGKEFGKWKAANKKLFEMVGELDVGVLNSTLKKGDATPEDVKRMLFSKKPSDIKLLYRNLTPEGKRNARVAILQKAVEQSDGIDNISPAKFATQVKKLGDSIGVFFKGTDLKKIEGLSRALELTRRADVAGVHPPTGVQNMPFIGGAVLADMFGSGGAAISSAIGIGTAARVLESRPVRNLLMKLPDVKPGSDAESALAKRLFYLMQVEYKKLSEEND